ncbi:YciE/YciF ferroxidase family protein [Sediminibacterium roseum]|nr:ferritin-like domain-containing protein [Sediminibacterium roseum]
MKNESISKRNGTNGTNGHNGTNGALKNGTADKKDGTKNNELPMLDKFFMDMLKDIYWAEKHLVETLPGMQRAATTDELQEAFEDHLLATQKHVSRLEKIFRKLGKEAQAKKCEAMAGLVEEAKSIIKETKDGTMTRDVALIIAAQKIEHYEIATYGSMVQLARTMDKEDIATILEQTLWEEEDTDQHLTQIAESSVNPKADLEGTEEEENGQETTMSSSAAAMS